MTQPQTEFMECTAKFPLFLAGYGAGKSTTQVISILDDLSYQGADVAAYAPTYDILKLVTIPYLEEFLTESNIAYKLNKADYIIKVEKRGKIVLRSMDNPARIVGYQVFRSHIDEIDTLKEKHAKDAWNKIIARNRQKVRIDGVRQQNRVAAYTTPEGFRFAYNTWGKDVASAEKKGYVMIRAPSYSNPELDEDYIQSLRDTYSAQLVEAYIEGHFVNLQSGAVYKDFDRQLNHTNAVVEGNEPIYVGMDFNVLKGAASIHVLRDGLPCAVDEIFNAYDTDEQIAILKNKYPYNPINVYPDASGKNRHSSNTTETDLVKLENAGFRIHVDYSNPAIKDRIASVNSMICNANGKRKYFVNTTACPNITDTLEQQVYGDNGLPDKTSGLDHIGDGIGYYINQEFPIVKPEANITIVRGGH